MPLDVTLNQYASGGAAKQLGDAVGLASSDFNQYYAAGGFAGQLCAVGGVSPASISQYHAGGSIGDFIVRASGGAYHASAVHFDGTDGTKVFRCPISLGITSSHTLLCAGWVGHTTAVGGIGFNGASDAVTYQQVVGILDNGDGTAFIQIELVNAAKSDIINFSGTVPINLATGFHSYAVSVDTASQTLQFMIDRQLLDTSSATWSSSEAIDMPTNDPYVLDTFGSGAGVVAEFSDFLYAVEFPFFDLSVIGNVNKLFSLSNKPLSWGDGSSVVGSAAQVVLSGNATNYGNNHGTGGDFVPQNFSYGDGTLTDATTSPSD